AWLGTRMSLPRARPKRMASGHVPEAGLREQGSKPEGAWPREAVSRTLRGGPSLGVRLAPRRPHTFSMRIHDEQPKRMGPSTAPARGRPVAPAQPEPGAVPSGLPPPIRVAGGAPNPDDAAAGFRRVRGGLGAERPDRDGVLAGRAAVRAGTG